MRRHFLLVASLVAFPSVTLGQPLDCTNLSDLEPQRSICACSQITTDSLERLQCFDEMAETLNLRRLALDELIRRILDRPMGEEALRAAITELDD